MSHPAPPSCRRRHRRRRSPPPRCSSPASRPPSSRPTRDPDGGIGGSLAIAANGLAALDVLGAGDAVRAIGLPIAGPA